jgi:hypothetical protein
MRRLGWPSPICKDRRCSPGLETVTVLWTPSRKPTPSSSVQCENWCQFHNPGVGQRQAVRDTSFAGASSCLSSRQQYCQAILPSNTAKQYCQAILPLPPSRRPFLEKPSVIHHPRHHRQLAQRRKYQVQKHACVAHSQEPSGRHRLDAFMLPWQQQSGAVFFREHPDRRALRLPSSPRYMPHPVKPGQTSSIYNTLLVGLFETSISLVRPKSGYVFVKILAVFRILLERSRSSKRTLRHERQENCEDGGGQRFVRSIAARHQLLRS